MNLPAPLSLPYVEERLAQIWAEAQRENDKLLADRPIAREAAQLESAIVASSKELLSLDAADLAELGDDANAAAQVLGRSHLIRRRIDTLVAKRLELERPLLRETEALHTRLAEIRTQAQRLVDADCAAVQALAQRLDAWNAPRVPIAQPRPWEQRPLTSEQAKQQLEARLGVA